jgi:hypothetical protein
MTAAGTICGSSPGIVTTTAARHTVPLEKFLHVFVPDKLAPACLRPSLPDRRECFFIKLYQSALLRV